MIVAVLSLKGGVGKTTLSVNAAVALGKIGARVLAVDCDPQFNLTSGLGYSLEPGEPSLADLLVPGGGVALSDAIRPEVAPGVDLVPSERLSLTRVTEWELPAGREGQQALARALEAARDSYDWVVLDAKPALDLLTLNVVAAADVVVAVVTPTRWSAEGGLVVADFVSEAVAMGVSHASFVGAVFNRVPGGRRMVTDLIVEDLREQRIPLFHNTIPERVDFQKSEYSGVPIVLSDPGSDAAVAIDDVIGEMVSRIDRLVQRGLVPAQKAVSR